MALAVLTHRIHEHMPVTKHLQFELKEWRDETLLLMAPLAVNANDKGSFFAGSQVALCTLAGWAFTTLLAEQEVEGLVDVVAVNSDIHYQVPLLTDAFFQVQPLNAALFKRRMQRRGKAKLKLDVQVLNQAAEVTSMFSAVYYAREPRLL